MNIGMRRGKKGRRMKMEGLKVMEATQLNGNIYISIDLRPSKLLAVTVVQSNVYQNYVLQTFECMQSTLPTSNNRDTRILRVIFVVSSSVTRWAKGTLLTMAFLASQNAFVQPVLEHFLSFLPRRLLGG